VTVRHAVLSFGALLVLGLGVYLLVEVRAQPGPVETAATGAVRSAPAAARMDEPERAARPAAPVPVTPPAVHSVAAPPSPPPVSAPPAGTSAQDDSIPLAGPKLDAAMDEANRAYDRGDYDEAKTIASRLLTRLPSNVRMLRIMVSASCVDGDAATAQASYAKLPPADQAQMRIRCARFGVSFPGP